MFERSKKAARSLKRLIAAAAVPALSLLAVSLMPFPSDTDAYALYIVSDDDYVHVDELEGGVFLTDGSAGREGPAAHRRTVRHRVLSGQHSLHRYPPGDSHGAAGASGHPAQPPGDGLRHVPGGRAGDPCRLGIGVL